MRTRLAPKLFRFGVGRALQDSRSRRTARGSSELHGSQLPSRATWTRLRERGQPRHPWSPRPARSQSEAESRRVQGQLFPRRAMRGGNGEGYMSSPAATTTAAATADRDLSGMGEGLRTIQLRGHAECRRVLHWERQFRTRCRTSRDRSGNLRAGTGLMPDGDFPAGTCTSHWRRQGWAQPGPRRWRPTSCRVGPLFDAVRSGDGRHADRGRRAGRAVSTPRNCQQCHAGRNFRQRQCDAARRRHDEVADQRVAGSSGRAADGHRSADARGGLWPRRLTCTTAQRPRSRQPCWRIAASPSMPRTCRRWSPTCARSTIANRRRRCRRRRRVDTVAPAKLSAA